MKRIINNCIVLASLGVIMSSCTQNFEDFNTNPYGITEKSLEQDYNDIGAAIPSVIRKISITTTGYQVAQNLCSDSWACYLATPTPFVGGSNNTTYKMTWKGVMWDSSYKGIMAPCKKIIERAEEKNQPQFAAWAKLIRVYGMQRVASLHGPIIYSEYGKSPTYSKYDSEKEFYSYVFNELDEVIQILDNYKDFKGFKRFDATTYKGDVKQWLKLANTLRLQLAMRILKADPILAEQQAEKAWTNPNGLLMTNKDNFNITLGNDKHPLSIISYSWNDTMMSAAMESFLVGYKDPRMEKMFSPAEESSLYSNHPNVPYRGIKNGANLVAKKDRIKFSHVGSIFKEISYQTVLSAAVVNFMLSECQIRGWNVGNKSAQAYYDDGVKLSFEQWGVSGYATYINNSTNTPIDYTDPKAATATENAFNATTNLTVAWNDTDSNEKKLERIITQKWIAGFPDSYIAWVDFRRTGYPKLAPIYKNDSNPSDGEIPNGEFIKRMNFLNREYETNSQGVQEAVQKLGGPDKISTRLWWDTGTNNF